MTPLDFIVHGLSSDWVALAALVVAVVTLIRVNEQIRIANEQLKQGAEEIELVKKDLAIQRQANKELRRKPDLRAMLGANAEYVQVNWFGTLQPTCFNAGIRSTRELRMRFYIPANVRVDLPPGVTARSTSIGNADDNERVKYAIVDAYNTDVLIYPGDFQNCEPQLTVAFSNPFVVLWEIDDEFGHYPPEGIGAIRVQDRATQRCALPNHARDFAAFRLRETSGQEQPAKH